MSTFSPETLNYLYQAGWSETRSVDTQKWLSRLAEADFATFPAVETFLKRFGGLAFTITPTERYRRHVHFDPGWDNTWGVSRETTEAFCQILNVKLCAIGETKVTYLMDEAGKVYLTYDGELYRFADTGEEAVERICTNTVSSSSILVAEI